MGAGENRAAGLALRAPARFVTSRYADLVLKNVTITLPEEVANWARIKAAEEKTTVSRLVCRMLENQMRKSDAYMDAYRQWKELRPTMDIDAANRLTREAAHERR